MLAKQAVVILSVSLFLAGCATTIAGKVVSPGGSKFDPSEARINIALLHQGGQAPFSVVIPVSESGDFETSQDLPKGKYLVEALVPGYEASSHTIEVGKSEKLRIQLVPVRKERGGTVGANMQLDLDRGTGGALLTPPNL